MNIVLDKLSFEEKVRLAFEEQLGEVKESAALNGIRKNALSAFLKQGIPGRKNEEYKYSHLEKIFRDEQAVLNLQGEKELKFIKAAVNSEIIRQFEISGISENRIVLVDGVLCKDLFSTDHFPDSIVVCSLTEAFQKHADLMDKHFSHYADVNADPFIALNTALATDGLFFYVPGEVKMEQPIHVMNIVTSSRSALIQPRNLFVFGKKSEIQIIETTDACNVNGNSIFSSLCEIFIEEDARVQFYRLQNNCRNLNLISTTQVLQNKNSHFDTNTVTLNAQWVRNNLSIIVNGIKAVTHLNGLFLAKADQHIDSHTLVDHRVPQCESNQLYKGILDEKSTGIFNGKIFVRKDAQKINAYQSSKNILLSDEATVDTKPQLEIYANDVKCSHGSSTGHLNEEALFYLRSRGLGAESSRRMLLYAFAFDVIKTIQVKAFRVYLDELISKQLGFEFIA